MEVKWTKSQPRLYGDAYDVPSLFEVSVCGCIHDASPGRLYFMGQLLREVREGDNMASASPGQGKLECAARIICNFVDKTETV